jgi:hypothetical protein
VANLHLRKSKTTGGPLVEKEYIIAAVFVSQAIESNRTAILCHITI